MHLVGAVTLGGIAVLFAGIAIQPLWINPPHDADSEIWASRASASLSLLAAFAAGLLL